MSNGKILEGKVALITGASRGIGLAVARKLGNMGAKLSLCARSVDKLQNVAHELKNAGVEVIIVATDVRSDDDILSLVEETKQAYEAIDILVNNAGIGYFGPFHEASEANWDSVLDTNLKSVFLLSKAVAKGMIERRTGHIINIASLAGKNAFAGGAIYCASKELTASGSARSVPGRWLRIFRRMQEKIPARCCNLMT
jgi:NADP-dependent 3-hydroxy acid dehydrogenase YdfG